MKLSTRRGTLLVNGTLAVLLLGAVGIAFSSLGGSTSSSADVASAAGGAARAVTVTRSTVTASVSASGAVESAQARSLGFGTNGTVKKIYVEVGDKVRKGQILARLDDSAAQESLDAAAAALDSADDDTSTAALYAQYVTARNTYRAAERTVAATVIKAPFAGTVTAVNGTVGGPASGGSANSSGSSGSSGSSTGSSGGSSRTASGSTGSGSTGFVELADTRELQLVGTFTESDITKLKIGQSAAVTFDALPGVTATGKVTQIQPTAATSNNVVQYPVTISFVQVPSEIRLGQTATVKVAVGQAENVLAVPSTVVTTTGGRSTVTVLRNGAQTPVQVEIGVRGDTLTEITSGLVEGDQVVRPAATGTNQQGGFPGFGGGGNRGGGGLGGVR
ncbi:efflux RND transporter periplasmic adaptor subunit [Streptosporangium sp. NPDC001559]|uniref:efflux RND transporter periplasmic adaptor subunit n=1 Tax=Streptosporangium sp. NPDC001559 TaxID=3366187 RepID=UPI0036EE64F2